jgi:hypothetical protein
MAFDLRSSGRRKFGSSSAKTGQVHHLAGLCRSRGLEIHVAHDAHDPFGQLNVGRQFSLPQVEIVFEPYPGVPAEQQGINIGFELRGSDAADTKEVPFGSMSTIICT